MRPPDGDPEGMAQCCACGSTRFIVGTDLLSSGRMEIVGLVCGHCKRVHEVEFGGVIKDPPRSVEATRQ